MCIYAGMLHVLLMSIYATFGKSTAQHTAPIPTLHKPDPKYESNVRLSGTWTLVAEYTEQSVPGPSRMHPVNVQAMNQRENPMSEHLSDWMY
jgi:hypothetical protein